jgi:RNA polymerase sigma-70 factor (ECF subfamily)
VIVPEAMAVEPHSTGQTLVALFNMLSSKLGGDAEPLEEAEILKLVDLARAGDAVAAQQLYRQHVGRVFRTVRGMLGSDVDAEDVTQDALLTVLTSLDHYSPRRGVRFVAWVMAIAVNTARRRFRRQRPGFTGANELADLPDGDADPERDANSAQLRKMLLDALAALGQRERDIVSLRYGAELNAKEIADLVRLEPAHVRKLLERARVRLRERIVPELEGDGEVQ